MYLDSKNTLVGFITTYTNNQKEQIAGCQSSNREGTTKVYNCRPADEHLNPRSGSNVSVSIEDLHSSGLGRDALTMTGSTITGKHFNFYFDEETEDPAN